ncbi:MAG: hypothetical protein LUB56_01005 [Coprobacillus sp.]|nr:hypothetical protein [Coprobacillus sp.]
MVKIMNFFKSTLGKYLLLAVVYIAAGICAYLLAQITAQIIANYGRALLNFFPTILSYIMPMFCVVIMWCYFNSESEVGRLRSMYIFIVTTYIAMGFAFIIHIFDISYYFGWNLNSTAMVTIWFPFDILIMIVIFLAIAGYVNYRYVVRKRAYRDSLENVETNENNPELEGNAPETAEFTPLSKKRIVMVSFYTMFATVFFGEACFSLTLIDGYMDPNLYGVIPLVLSLLLPTLIGVFYVIYQVKKDEKIFRLGLLVCLITALVIYLWCVIALAINPQIIPQSIVGLMPVGFAMRTPLGLILCGAQVLASLIVGLIYYILRVIRKPEATPSEVETTENIEPENN